MKRILLVVLVNIVPIIGYCHKIAAQEPGEFHSTGVDAGDSLADMAIINKSFIAPNGEKFLRFEITLDAPIDSVWKVFTREDELKTWMAPVISLDLKMGGVIKTNYNPKAGIGDPGTITLGIVNYIPYQLMTYKVNLTQTFPEKCRKEDENLQEVILFKDLGDKTMIVSTMLGWGTGKEWDGVYNFFEKGNRISSRGLVKRFLKQ